MLLRPIANATHDLVAVKAPTVVYFNGKWHVYASSVDSTGSYGIVYFDFADWADAPSAPIYYLD